MKRKKPDLDEISKLLNAAAEELRGITDGQNATIFVNFSDNVSCAGMAGIDGNLSIEDFATHIVNMATLLQLTCDSVDSGIDVVLRSADGAELDRVISIGNATRALEKARDKKRLAKL